MAVAVPCGRIAINPITREQDCVGSSASSIYPATATIVAPLGINTSTLTVTSGTQGSVLFYGSGGSVTQDNSNFYFDGTNFFLGVGTGTPANSLHLLTSSGQTPPGIRFDDIANGISSPFALADVRKGPSLAQAGLYTFRSFSAGANPGGFGWGLVSGSELFKMDVNNSRFHIIDTTGTASLNVLGNALIGSGAIGQTAPTDGMLVSGAVTVQSTFTVTGSTLAINGTTYSWQAGSGGSGQFLQNNAGVITSAVASGGGGGGYALEPATVTIKVATMTTPAGYAGITISTPVFVVTTSTLASTINNGLIVTGHIEVSSTTPVISSCGATPNGSAVGNDVSGKVTVGGGIVTSCTMTFAVPWVNAPACWTNSGTAITNGTATTTTTTLTLGAGATFNGDVIMYGCVGYR